MSYRIETIGTGFGITHGEFVTVLIWTTILGARQYNHACLRTPQRRGISSGGCG